ncbi:hypothetical protein ARTHRO9V_100195 [Arthrobacter sp. 9V]|nr:hypothetical protein ARTHRO9V_100195 [Arthrobacter sp. 9V]
MRLSYVDNPDTSHAQERLADGTD